MIKFFNTLTRASEAFSTIDGSQNVRYYSCGPTVHDYAHIGNFRSFIWADMLKRYLRTRGYQVTHVMNITDVDDKTIKKSAEQKCSLTDYTTEYTEKFLEDLKVLEIEPADQMPRATECVPEMVEIIAGLLEKGFAYKATDGSVYFEVKKFTDYGKLAHIDREKLAAGASGRVARDEYTKDDVSDFALWKAYNAAEDGDVAWDTPFGKGRPGWHIECSAMARKHLGDTFDIHTGGIDLIFPHHQNEIAQSEAFTGKLFVKYWMHCEHLLVEGKKMSKSLGNFFTLRDILAKGYDPMAFRYLVAASHYRAHLNFTFEGLDAATNTIRNLANNRSRLRAYVSGDAAPAAELSAEIAKAVTAFDSAMDDDLNTPAAVATLNGMVAAVLKEAQRSGIVAGATLGEAEAALDSMLGVLGVRLPAAAPLTEAKSTELAKLLEGRTAARTAKDWPKADAIKGEISALGIDLIDTKSGTKWYQTV